MIKEVYAQVLIQCFYLKMFLFKNIPTKKAYAAGDMILRWAFYVPPFSLSSNKFKRFQKKLGPLTVVKGFKSSRSLIFSDKVNVVS